MLIHINHVGSCISSCTRIWICIGPSSHYRQPERSTDHASRWRDMPVYVTKDDAREAQRAESLFYGGVIPSGGMASQMQVSGREEFEMIALTRFVECCR